MNIVTKHFFLVIHSFFRRWVYWVFMMELSIEYVENRIENEMVLHFYYYDFFFRSSLSLPSFVRIDAAQLFLVKFSSLFSTSFVCLADKSNR